MAGSRDEMRLPLATVVGEWGRIGCIGFGGPPVHVHLLRELCVVRRGWIEEAEFEDAIATTNLLPGPASTQLAIYCAWRLAGVRGALAGGLCFIVPGLALIILLSTVFLATAPPAWVLGAGAGSGAAVAAVAVHAAAGLAPASRQRAASSGRWLAYVILGAAAAATVGAWLVLVLLACGLLEAGLSRRPHSASGQALPVVLAATAVAGGGVLALVWMAFKVGTLSYGGGFVIIPLMQHDAVAAYGWMTPGQFLNGVALGQVTPGPVVQTVAVVGYAAAGVGGALLASVVAFGPSFWLMLIGADRFDRLRADRDVRAFLGGAGPAAVGAIAGVAIPLAAALGQWWQVALLVAAALALMVGGRGVVTTLLASGVIGALAVGLGAVPPP